MDNYDDKLLENLQKQLLRKLYAWLVLGGIAVGGVGGSGVLRVDKFGHSDFSREMKSYEERLDKIDAIQQTMLFRMARREEDAKSCNRRLDAHIRLNHD